MSLLEGRDAARRNVVALAAIVPLPVRAHGRVAQSIAALRARLRTLRPPWHDARLFQIAFLATLLTIGVLLRDFALQPAQMALTFAAGLATQALFLRALGIRQRGYLSAVITCFGLSILLRADTLWVHPAVAAIAIGSKFLLRIGDKHVYNPANLGVIAASTLLPGAWVSPGQWGQDLALAAWFVMLGGFVANRARRSDIAWLFLASWFALVGARILWLGQSWPILVHQLTSGALLLFAFFMISDPMTIPNRAAARVAYAMLVAAIAFGWQFGLSKPNGLVWALFLASPLVPVIDRLWPGERFEWRERRG